MLADFNIARARDRAVIVLAGLFESSASFRLRFGRASETGRLMLEVCRAKNIPDALTRYRINSHGLSASSPPNWRQRTDALRRLSWQRLGVEYEPTLIPHLIELLFVGADIPDRHIRALVCRTTLMLLVRFLAASQPMQRKEEDYFDACQLKSTVVGRVFKDRSIVFEWLFSLRLLCWHFIARL